MHGRHHHGPGTPPDVTNASGVRLTPHPALGRETAPSSTGRDKWAAEPQCFGWNNLYSLFSTGLLHVPYPPCQHAPSQAGRASWRCHPPPSSSQAAASQLVQPQCKDAPTKAQHSGLPRKRLPSQFTAVSLRDPPNLMMLWLFLKTQGPGGMKQGKVQLSTR